MSKSKLVESVKNPNLSLARTLPWTGPSGNGPQGGISQSLLGKFLACRHRFKVHVIDGWQGPDNFKPAMEYGNLWHRCEESVVEGRDWRDDLKADVIKLADRYPMDREKISHWYEMCQEQYPIYLDYWQEEGEIVGRKPLLREQNFDVPYTLPSGRTVRLRGKWDGIDLVESSVVKHMINGKTKQIGTEKGLYLYENKTKSQIDADKLKKQLSFDLQTMFYIVALQECHFRALEENIASVGAEKGMVPSPEVFNPNSYDYPIKGVLYNVIKRSQHKTASSMVKKIHEDLDTDRGGEWFGRWTVDISQAEIETFKEEFLHPCLTFLCIWYDVQTGKPWTQWHGDNIINAMHWRHPSGCFNEVDENGSSVVDQFLKTGSTVGLVRIKSLFPELDVNVK